MDIIYKSVYGSHLYGTTVEGSDVDHKAIFLPTAEQVLLGKIPHKTKRDGDIDFECISISKFLQMVSEGQTMAYELLFTPEDKVLVHSPIMAKYMPYIRSVMTKDVSGFVGYCKTQAEKFGIKGQRLSALIAVCKRLNQYLEIHRRAEEMKLEAIPEILNGLIDDFPEHCNFTVKDNKGFEETYFSCCGLMVPMGAKIRDALIPYEKQKKQYGRRANEALDGKDWKAIMHALRIGDECIELMETGTITFPRPNAEFLKEVRLGKIPQDTVFNMIETNINTVKRLDSDKEVKDVSNELRKAIIEIHYDIVKSSYTTVRDDIRKVDEFAESLDVNT